MTDAGAKRRAGPEPLANSDFDATIVRSFESLSLPALPAVLRYVNEGGKTTQGRIVSPSTEDVWWMTSRGITMTLRFDAFPAFLRPLLKVVSAESLRRLMPASVAANFNCLKRAGAKRIVETLLSTPSQVATNWPDLAPQSAIAQGLRPLLTTACKLSCFAWSPVYARLVDALRAPYDNEGYRASIKSGEAVLDSDEEGVIARHLRDIAIRVTEDPASVDNDELRHATVLACIYQFGMRPVQIWYLTWLDFKLRYLADKPTVHLTFRKVKQKNGNVITNEPIHRRVNPAYIPLFIEWQKRFEPRVPSEQDRFWPYVSPTGVVSAMVFLLDKLGLDGRSAYDLRHTGAQRLADRGATIEEISDWLGNEPKAALYYFDASPKHASRINKALALSPIYTKVAAIASNGFIDPDELMKLKDDEQIGAMPHGIAIAGIGQCKSGQPSCPYNPVLSCYDCRRFVPVRDAAIHREALQGLRMAAKGFAVASGFEPGTSAYMELEPVMTKIIAIVAEIEQRP